MLTLLIAGQRKQGKCFVRHRSRREARPFKSYKEVQQYVGKYDRDESVSDETHEPGSGATNAPESTTLVTADKEGEKEDDGNESPLESPTKKHKASTFDRLNALESCKGLLTPAEYDEKRREIINSI